MPFLFFILLTLGGADASTWAQALRAGQFDRAGALLNALAARPRFGLQPRDVEPARHLADLYSRGIGVPYDPIAACTLANTAAIAATNTTAADIQDPKAYHARLADADRLIARHCGGLSNEDQRAASLTIGCHAFAMPEETVQLGPHLVRIGRAGIRVAETPGATVSKLHGCPLYVAAVKTRSVEPRVSVNGVSARHFVEVLSWELHQPAEATAGYALTWRAYELQGNTFARRGQIELRRVAAWPHSPAASDRETRVTLEMDHAGRVRWHLEGRSPKRGWLAPPE